MGRPRSESLKGIQQTHIVCIGTHSRGTSVEAQYSSLAQQAPLQVSVPAGPACAKHSGWTGQPGDYEQLNLGQHSRAGAELADGR